MCILDSLGVFLSIMALLLSLLLRTMNITRYCHGKKTQSAAAAKKSVMIKVNLGAAFPRLRNLLIANGRRFERGQISNLFGMSIFVIFIANLVGSGIKQTVLMN